MIRRTADDVAAWIAFAGQVEAAVRNPGKSMVALERAAARASKAVLPCEPMAASNPWLTCLREAKSFAGQLGVSRRDLAGQLAHALEAAQAHCRLSTAPAAGDRAADPADPDPPNPGRSRWWEKD